MEEERLADRRLHRFRLEGLGDQEGRLGTLAGQQPLGEGGDEDDGNVEALEDVLDRVDARGAVGQLDVGQDQARLMARHGVDRLIVGGGRAGDAVAQLPHQAFDVGRDDGLVLDDQDVGGQFRVDVGLGLGDQTLDRARVDGQDLGGLGRGEAFQSGEQEGLARARRDAHQAVGGVVALGRAAVLELGAGGRPDGVEDVIQGDARRHVRGQLALARREGLERHADVVVACALIPGQRTGVAADIRQMRRKSGQKAHSGLPRRSQRRSWGAIGVVNVSNAPRFPRTRLA
ncbi:hypothetical protein D3C80_764030 [compost metagenome]